MRIKITRKSPSAITLRCDFQWLGKCFMLSYTIKNRKGQSTLETALIFIVLIAFLMAITNIWLWSNNQIVQRQVQYNNSRVEAGTSSDSYTLKWPVYTPPDLTENEVILR